MRSLGLIYTCPETRKVIVRWFSGGSPRPMAIKHKGRVYERTDVGQAAANACWPMNAWACSISPKQVKSANAKLEALGVKSRWDKQGDLEHRDRNCYNDFLKKTGRYNIDAGFGDWAGGEGNHEIPERLAWAKKRA